MQKNRVRPVVIVMNQIRVTQNAVSYAPLAFFVLSIPMFHENRSRRNFDFLFQERFLRQPLLLMVIVFVNMRARSEIGEYFDMSSSDKIVSR